MQTPIVGDFMPYHGTKANVYTCLLVMGGAACCEGRGLFGDSNGRLSSVHYVFLQL